MQQFFKRIFSSKNTKTLTEKTAVSVFNGLAKYEIPKNCTVTAKFGKNNIIKDEKNKNKATIKAVQGNTKYDYEFTKENQNVILSTFTHKPGGDNCEVKVKEYNKTQQEFTDERIKIEAMSKSPDDVLKDIKDNVKKNFFTKNNLPDFKELSKYVSEENINLLKKYSNISIKRKMSVRDIKSKYYVNGRDTLFNNILSNNIISGLRDTDIVEVEETVNFDAGSYTIKFSNGGKTMKYNVIMSKDLCTEDISLEQGGRTIISQQKEYKSGEQDFLDIRNFDDTDLDIPDFDSVYRKDMDSFVLTTYQDFTKHKRMAKKRTIYYQGVISSDSAVFQGFIDRQNFNLIDGEQYKVIFSASRHEYDGEYSIPNAGPKWYDRAKPKGTGTFKFGIDDNLTILGKTVQFKKGAIVECGNWNGLKTITEGEEGKPIEIRVDYNGETKNYTFEKEKDESDRLRVICRDLDSKEEVDPNDICHADENLEEAGAGLYGGGYDTGKPGTYSGGSGARRGGADSTRTPSSSRNIERSKTPDDERTDEKNNKKDDKKKDDKEKKTEDEDDENKKISLNNENAKLSLDRNNMSKKPEFNVMLFILLLLTIVGAILYWMDYKDKLEKYENNKRYNRMMTRF